MKDARNVLLCLTCFFVAIIPARPYRARDKAYVSYCTSSRLREGESRLFGASAALAF